MNLNTLILFQKAALSESLSQAARSAGISQPTLSRTIKLMEKELGFSLFDRSPNRISLNKNGEAFLTMSQDILSRYNKCISQIREENGINSPMLTIAFTSTGNNLPRITYEFRKKYPQSRFTLLTKPYSSSDTESTFFFTSSYHRQSGKGYRLLATEHLYVTVGPGHRLEREKSVSLSSLAGETFLYSSEDNDMYSIQMHYLESAGIMPRAENIIGKQNVLIMLLRYRMGMALLPRVDIPDIRQIPISDIDCIRYVYLIRNPNVFETRLAKEFEKFAVAFYRKLQE